MRNFLTITLMIAALFLMVIAPTTNSIAQMEADMEYSESDYTISGVTLWLDGWVAVAGSSPAIGIEDVRVTCVTCNNPITVYTDANGYWYMQYHSYCGSKSFTFQKDGYTTVNISISDNSCPECICPEDPEAPGCGTCDNHIRKTVYMEPGGSTDSDADGVWDSIDNCYLVPNGWKLGTCTRGGGRVYARSCQAHSDCGCDGYCSKAQENCDGDAYGNACDECMVTSGGCKSGPCPQFASLSDIHPIHELLEPKLSAQWSEEDQRTFWFVIGDLWWRGHNNTSYGNFFEFLIGIGDGPDRLCNECVRDFNNNGICDNEEPFEDRVFVGPVENMRNIQEKFQYCLEKIRNCTEEDREEDPFGCIM